MRLGLGLRLSDRLPGGGVVAKSTLVNDLVAYWPLGETSGARNDVVGTYNLTDNNTVGYDTGVNGNAASFASGNAEDLSKTGVTLPAVLTVSTWIKTGTLADSYAKVFSVEGETTLENFQLSVYVVAGTLYGVAGDGTGYVVCTGAAPPVGSFQHVLVTVDSDKKVRIYQDNGTAAVSDAIAGTPYRTAAPLVIGGGRGYGAPDNYWDGLIDEVAIWSRVLTADERAELYNSGSGKFYNATSEDFEE